MKKFVINFPSFIHSLSIDFKLIISEYLPLYLFHFTLLLNFINKLRQ